MKVSDQSPKGPSAHRRQGRPSPGGGTVTPTRETCAACGLSMRAAYLFQVALLVALLVARTATATLVAAVSFRDGFVAASDRRGTATDGTFVDNYDKIHAAGSALVVVTNANKFWLKSDLAKNYETTPPAFVLSDEIATLTPAVVSKRDLPAISKASARALGAFFEWDKELYASVDVALVDFLLPTWEAGFLISTDASGTPVSSTPELRDVGLDTPIYVLILGQPQYLQKVIAAHLVSTATLQTLASPPRVRDMTLDAATALASDLVESAERATAVIPPRWGIGGGLDLWSVTGTGPHHILTK